MIEKRTLTQGYRLNTCLGRGVVSLAIALSVLGLACSKEPSRWDNAATATLVAPSVPKVVGGKLNAFFPADGTDGYSRVFTQEKDGFVELQLKKEDRTVATLTISDASSDAEAKAKFASSTERLESFPLVTVGKKQTAVLVADRYQVKVSSGELEPEARNALLGKFNLKGLAALQ